MKKSIYFLYSLISGIYFSASMAAAPTVDVAATTPIVELSRWKEVGDISAIQAHAETKGRGVFLIDADEVLFTSSVNPDGSVSLRRLYPDLETLFSEVKKNGHEAYILTYNKADEIRHKLSQVGLAESFFDGILSCEMAGKLDTSKGDLLRKHIELSKENPYDFAVFIDNFPPFVKNVQEVAKEFTLPLHAYLCTGYIPLYHQYVYHHLGKLHALFAEAKKTSEIEQIQRSLDKYGIDISTFLEKYPDLESFMKFAKDQALIWPYLVYL